MSKINVIDSNVKKCGIADFGLLLNEAYRPDILHQVIRWQTMINKVPNAAKSRGDLSYSTKKMYSQRRSGRSRRGAFGAPQTRGGGVAFAPKPILRDFKCLKKMRRQALRIALTNFFENSNLLVVKDLNTIQKTAQMNKFLLNFNIDRSNRALIIDQCHNKGARSLHIADTLPVIGLNLRSLLRCKKIILAEDCIDEIKQRIRI